MGFTNLIAQPPVFPAEAAAYSEKCLALSWEAVQRMEGKRDIAYGPEPGQALDVYRPGNPPGRRGLPVLIFLHGGAWTNGYKEWSAFNGEPVVKFPAVFVAPTYRLAPGNRLPALLSDTIAAIRWVWLNIAEHGGDPNRIFVAGHSAGGHLAALATLRRELYPADLPRDAVKGCFPVSSQMNFDFPKVAPGSSEERMLSVLFDERSEALEGSPIHHVADNRTPFYLACGENDFPRIVRSNRQMARALRAIGCDVRLNIFSGRDHFDMHLDLVDPSHRWFRTVRGLMGNPASLRSAA